MLGTKARSLGCSQASSIHEAAHMLPRRLLSGSSVIKGKNTPMAQAFLCGAVKYRPAKRLKGQVRTGHEFDRTAPSAAPQTRAVVPRASAALRRSARTLLLTPKRRPRGNLPGRSRPCERCSPALLLVPTRPVLSKDHSVPL